MPCGAWSSARPDRGVARSRRSEPRWRSSCRRHDTRRDRWLPAQRTRAWSAPVASPAVRRRRFDLSASSARLRGRPSRFGRGSGDAPAGFGDRLRPWRRTSAQRSPVPATSSLAEAFVARVWCRVPRADRPASRRPRMPRLTMERHLARGGFLRGAPLGADALEASSTDGTVPSQPMRAASSPRAPSLSWTIRQSSRTRRS